MFVCLVCARAMGLKKEELERLMLASADKKRKGSWLQSFEASLDSILNEPEKEDREQAEAPPLEERLGPATVCIDLDACNGDVNLDEDRLSMESLSNFCSARTNVCVVSGAWQYEVILGTAGVQQVGWATPTCPFTNEEGVGDFPDSYAYDGKRVRKWNVSCHPYGQPWMTGDVIGCCFNVDEGEISFYRNGKPLGVAFKNVRRHMPGIAYFPAFSLSHGERCVTNFGSMPFRYPVSGFKPIQEPPKKSFIQTGSLILEALDVITASDTVKDSLTVDENFLIVNALCDRLVPMLLNSYFVEGTLIPFLIRKVEGCDESSVVATPKVMTLLSEHLNESELDRIVHCIFRRISELCRSSFSIDNLSFAVKNVSYLKLGNMLIENRRIRQVLFASDKFVESMEGLLTQKQPNSHDLATLLPNVWWHGAQDTGITEEEMKAACSSLENSIMSVEKNQVKFILSILRHSKDAFKRFVRAILKKNRGALRNVQPPGLSDNSVLTSLYYVLLRLVRPLLKADSTNDSGEGGSGDGVLKRLLPATAFSKLFLERDEPDHFIDASRLGGTFSHLKKSVDMDKLKDLELDVNVPYQSVLNAGIYDSVKSLDSTFMEYHEQFLESIGDDTELVALVLDSVNWLYHLGLASKCKQASLQLQNQVSAISQLEDATKRSAEAEPINPEYHKHLKEACSLFREDVIESVRQCSWYKALLYTTWKQEAMFAMCIFQTRLLLAVSEHEALLQFVPESYVETVMDSFHAFRRGVPPVRCWRGYGLEDIITFLVLHFNDERIVNPDVRDVMFQSISVLLQYRDFVVAFEENKSAQEVFIESLLECFDSRFWIPVSNILLRLCCKGMGFGEQQQKKKEEEDVTYGSLIFQQLLQDTCKGNQKLFDAFVNRLFTICNWTATEFTVASKEIKHLSDRQGGIGSSGGSTGGVELQQQQRKLTIMVELTQNLLRLLEAVVRILPNAFNSSLHSSRLLELAIFLQQQQDVPANGLQLPLCGICKSLDWPPPEELREKMQEEEVPDDIPDEFLDPIQYTLMRDPVTLPSSKVTVDRATIQRHLLSDQTDPFNRSKLEEADLIPDLELKEKIEEWLASKKK